MKVEISDGELLDKLSILEIKAIFIGDEEKLKNVNKEIEELQEKKDKTKDERKRLAEARKERASEIREFKKSMKGFSEVGYKEGGVRKELYIKDEMMEQMENPDEVLKSGRAMEMASYWLGAKFLRQMATGINVMFPLSNIPMDFRHIVMFTDVFDDNTPGRMIYNPGHPHANEDGMVEMPNVDVSREMVDLISASRAYEANLSVVKTSRRMAQQAMAIGK